MRAVLQLEKQHKSGPLTAYIKGAPERVLAKCSTYLKDGEMVPMSDEEVLRAHERLMDGPPLAGDDEEEVLGPKLVPISPIMRYAMQEVVQEYYADDDRTESEYASLSDADVQEY